MHGQQVDLLKALLTAASGWRDTTITAGGELTQVNVTFPDGRGVTLFWDIESEDWLVDS